MIIALSYIMAGTILGIITLLESIGCNAPFELGIALIMLVSRVTGIDVVDALVQLIKNWGKW